MSTTGPDNPEQTRVSTDPLTMDDEKLSARIGRVFCWLRDKYRQSWKASRRTTAAEEDILSRWGYGFFGKWHSEVRRIVVLGLEDPGTLEELLQHRRGELRGAPLERQRVIFTQIAMIQYLTRILGMKYPNHNPSVVVHSPDFSQQTLVGLKHLNIIAIRHLGQAINRHTLVVDLRTEQGPDIDGSNLNLIVAAGGHRGPRAILKRCSTITPSGYRKLVPSVARDYYVYRHMELPSHPAPMREAEQVWFHEVRESLQRSKEREGDGKQEEGKSDGNEDNPILKGYEQRAAELARNMMVLVVRKPKKRPSAGVWASYW